MLARLQIFPDDTSPSYACVNVDTAALRVKIAICPWFRGYKSTSECMRGMLWDPRSTLLLWLITRREVQNVGRGYQTWERDLARRAWGVYIQTHVTCLLKPRAYLDSHTGPPGHRRTFTDNEQRHRTLQSKPYDVFYWTKIVWHWL